VAITARTAHLIKAGGSFPRLLVNRLFALPFAPLIPPPLFDVDPLDALKQVGSMEVPLPNVWRRCNCSRELFKLDGYLNSISFAITDSYPTD
jgi:hypothetical protein